MSQAMDWRPGSQSRIELNSAMQQLSTKKLEVGRFHFRCHLHRKAVFNYDSILPHGTWHKFRFPLRGQGSRRTSRRSEAAEFKALTVVRIGARIFFVAEHSPLAQRTNALAARQPRVNALAVVSWKANSMFCESIVRCATHTQQMHHSQALHAVIVSAKTSSQTLSIATSIFHR